MCGYDGGDCSREQIATKCVKDLELSRVDYSASPQSHITPALTRGSLWLRAGLNGTLTEGQARAQIRPKLVQTSFIVEADPANLVLLQDLNKVALLQEMDYTLQWADPRLFTSPCYAVLQSELSMSKEDALSDITRAAKGQQRRSYWIPRLVVDSLIAGFDRWDEEVEVLLERSSQWNHGITPLGEVQDTSLEYAVQWAGKTEVQVTQSFEYQKYPFDHQMISITFRVKGAHLFTCSHGSILPTGIPHAQAQYEKLLPSTGEWLLDGPAPEAVSTSHPLLVDPVTGLEYEDLSSCVLTIAVRRNPLVFIVKSLATSIVVVFFSLSVVLHMQPNELMGDRFAVLFSAQLSSSQLLGRPSNLYPNQIYTVEASCLCSLGSRIFYLGDKHVQ